MSGPKPERSRIATNRMAVAIVVGSIVVAVALAGLYWSGALEAFVPDRGPAADAVPLYLLLAGLSVALVLWSWKRVLSLLA
ncbi:hypothetical protein [Halopiger djelfimassiliensis]|uniref:hypothetical protein n=1 Tax=Halopiger djelfimassiliensis TaxID=1293047 RepID=UPI0006782A0D|nr:hypothetical protein [Halopiger djelfimassiliensis]